jgi:hypothetical protein
MMRKSLWIVPLLLLSAGIGSTTARADSFDYYSISFGGPNAPTAAAGTVLTYDATTQQFTTPSFSLTFEGNVYTMDLATTPDADNPPTTDPISWMADPSNDLRIYDTTTTDFLYQSTTIVTPAAVGDGLITLTATSAPVPEIDPTTGISALTLLVGAVLVIRGRRRTMTQPESGWERA